MTLANKKKTIAAVVFTITNTTTATTTTIPIVCLILKVVRSGAELFLVKGAAGPLISADISTRDHDVVMFHLSGLENSLANLRRYRFAFCGIFREIGSPTQITFCGRS